MKIARSSHCLCFMDRYIYILGGLDNSSRCLSACEKFDINSKKVESISPMKYASIYACCASFNGRYIFKFGGLGEEGQILANIERYDQRLDTWTEIDPEIDNPVRGQFMALSTSAAIQVSQSEIFVFGGYDSKYAGSAQSYVLRVGDIERGDYIITRVNEFPLPVPEAFWNNSPVLMDRTLFCLQNVPSEVPSECIENARTVLTFDGRGWNVLN
jgi:hypothetical protein